MRINVYSQELTGEVALLNKTDEQGNVHYGVRMFFEGSSKLQRRDDDDDRSAITYWLPNDGCYTKDDLACVFAEAARLARMLE